MPNIKLLPQEVINRIKAGEIIERPSNVVKELIENSIDAKAQNILIEIVQSGKRMIRVVDDGVGMDKDDLLMCFKPHATSKIDTFEDIYNLKTLGFRGEALSSITSVSKTKIFSKTNSQELGYCVTVSNGEVISLESCSMNKGTIVEVRDLFFNTPARLKFLKSDYTEKIHIIKIIEEYAIAYNDISFRLYSDNKNIFSFEKKTNILERIKDVLGKDVVDNLIFFEYKNELLSSFGFISTYEFAQVNKSLQFFFINRRPVSCKILNEVLYDIYENTLPTGRHPIGIIFIEISGSFLDINVHPTKRVVKFKDESYIYKTLKENIHSQVIYKLKKPKNFLYKSIKFQTLVEENKTHYETFSNEQNEILLFEEKNKLTNNLQKLGFNNYIYLGQLHKTYLILETDKGITFIDQHAASERIMYEKFLNSKEYFCQKLLMPLNIELKISDFETILPYLDLINKVGFEVSISGRSSLGFYGIPSIFKINDVKDFILKFIENLVKDIKEDKLQQDITPKEKIIRSACRAAIKANEILTSKDVENLIKDLSNCIQPYTCPHGRPTLVNVEIKDIQKLFLRQK